MRQCMTNFPNLIGMMLTKRFKELIVVIRKVALILLFFLQGLSGLFTMTDIYSVLNATHQLYSRCSVMQSPFFAILEMCTQTGSTSHHTGCQTVSLKITALKATKHV